MYCDLASDFAREHWGVKLEPGWHPTLPFMGPAGCTVAPHLRPICTAHTCEVNEHGCKRGDDAWTSRYYDLLEEIQAIEEQVFGRRAV
jgi:hypothetical protein